MPSSTSCWRPSGWESIDVSTARGDGGLNENLGWLLNNMSYYVPVDFATRKGSFGVYLHTLFLGLNGDAQLLEGSHILEPIELDWHVPLFLIDAGVSYELGRWRLWDGAISPELTRRETTRDSVADDTAPALPLVRIGSTRGARSGMIGRR